MQFETNFRSRRSNVMATHGMVATSQPLAAQAGLEILRAGGNAADAAIATVVMLGVVEPLYSGVGGDAFALYWDAKERVVSALNGSGRAAAGASIDELRRLGCERIPGFTGHAVSVPGAVAAWCDLLERFGSMPLGELMKPAIQAAREGFPVSEWIAEGYRGKDRYLLRSGDPEGADQAVARLRGPEQPSGKEMLLDGRAPRAGELLRFPQMAETLEGIAAEGRDFIYTGEFARRLSEHVQRYGGWITPQDMAAHRSSWEEPITADYRGCLLHECPPNGQGLAAVVAANLAAGFDLASMDETERVHILVECMRLGFADAHQWVCDMHEVKIPLAELTGGAYAERRRKLIDPNQAARHVEAGDPRAASDTVYLSVVDGEGNACSFISSLSAAAGSGLVVPGTGICLQNRSAMLLLDPDHPNALAPGKRPYHTIIPAMITRGGELYASYGVMGGFMQPQGHLQMLSNLVDLGLSPQQALDLPRWRLPIEGGGVGAGDPGGRLLMEEGWTMSTYTGLTRKGNLLGLVDGFDREKFGGGQIIVRDAATGVLTGGSDPRKDGCAAGY